MTGRSPDDSQEYEIVYFDSITAYLVVAAFFLAGLVMGWLVNDWLG